MNKARSTITNRAPIGSTLDCAPIHSYRCHSTWRYESPAWAGAAGRRLFAQLFARLPLSSLCSLRCGCMPCRVRILMIGKLMLQASACYLRPAGRRVRASPSQPTGAATQREAGHRLRRGAETSCVAHCRPWPMGTTGTKTVSAIHRCGAAAAGGSGNAHAHASYVLQGSRPCCVQVGANSVLMTWSKLLTKAGGMY